jgi:hypothetical protein
MKSAMLTPLQQKRVWEGLLGAEIRANYFADLSTRYARKQRLSTWCTLFASSGAAVSVLAKLPTDLTWVTPTLAIVTAGISLYSVVMQNQKFAVDSSDLHARWSRLANDYQRLWDDMYSTGAMDHLNSLLGREEELSKAGTAFPNRRGLMEKWEEHVVSHHASELTA